MVGEQHRAGLLSFSLFFLLLTLLFVSGKVSIAVHLTPTVLRNTTTQQRDSVWKRQHIKTTTRKGGGEGATKSHFSFFAEYKLFSISLPFYRDVCVWQVRAHSSFKLFLSIFYCVLLSQKFAHRHGAVL